jgi:hypothetical protein
VFGELTEEPIVKITPQAVLDERRGLAYDIIPRLLEPNEIREGLERCLGDPERVCKLMARPATALGVFRLFAALRLWQGCSHGWLQHRFLEDMAACGVQASGQSGRGLQLDEAEIRRVARVWVELPLPQPGGATGSP